MKEMENKIFNGKIIKTEKVDQNFVTFCIVILLLKYISVKQKNRYAKLKQFITQTIWSCLYVIYPFPKISHIISGLSVYKDLTNIFYRIGCTIRGC